MHAFFVCFLPAPLQEIHLGKHDIFDHLQMAEKLEILKNHSGFLTDLPQITPRLRHIHPVNQHLP